MAGPRAPTEVPGKALKTRGQQAWHRPRFGAATRVMRPLPGDGTRTPPVSPAAPGRSPSWALGEGDSLLAEGFLGRWPRRRVSHSQGRCSPGPGTHAWPEAGQVLSLEPWVSHCATLCAGRSLLTGAAPCPPGASTQCAGRVASTYHIHCAEDVAVMVASLQVLGDVGKGAQVLWVLSRAGNVPDLVLGDDVLRRKRLCSAPSPALLFCRPNATSSSALWGRGGLGWRLISSDLGLGSPPLSTGGRGWRLISSDLGLGSPPLSTAAEGVNVHIQPPLALQGPSAGPGDVLRSLRPVSSEVAHAEEDKLSPGTQVRGCMRG